MILPPLVFPGKTFTFEYVSVCFYLKNAIFDTGSGVTEFLPDDFQVLHAAASHLASQSTVHHPLHQVRKRARTQVPRLLHRWRQGQPQGQHRHLRQDYLPNWPGARKAI